MLYIISNRSSLTAQYFPCVIHWKVIYYITIRKTFYQHAWCDIDSLSGGSVLTHSWVMLSNRWDRCAEPVLPVGAGSQRGEARSDSNTLRQTRVSVNMRMDSNHVFMFHFETHPHHTQKHIFIFSVWIWKLSVVFTFGKSRHFGRLTC